MEDSDWIDTKLNFPPLAYLVLKVNGKQACVDSHHSWNDRGGTDVIIVSDLKSAGILSMLKSADHPLSMIVQEEHLDSELLVVLDALVEQRKNEVLDSYCESMARNTLEGKHYFTHARNEDKERDWYVYFNCKHDYSEFLKNII